MINAYCDALSKEKVYQQWAFLQLRKGLNYCSSFHSSVKRCPKLRILLKEITTKSQKVAAFSAVTSGSLSTNDINTSFQFSFRRWPCLSWSSCKNTQCLLFIYIIICLLRQDKTAALKHFNVIHVLSTLAVQHLDCAHPGTIKIALPDWRTDAFCKISAHISNYELLIQWHMQFGSLPV